LSFLSLVNFVDEANSGNSGLWDQDRGKPALRAGNAPPTVLNQMVR